MSMGQDKDTLQGRPKKDAEKPAHRQSPGDRGDGARRAVTEAVATSGAPAGMQAAPFLTLPNALTLFRVASAPMFLAAWFGLAGEWRDLGLWVCLVIACLSEASDLLDGWLARRAGLVSTFGKLMDPYADSIFRLTAFLSFASPPHGPFFPVWMPILLVLRDIGASVVRTFAMEQGFVVAAKASGKIKAIAQGFVMISLLVLALARTELGVRARDFPRDAAIMMGIVIVVAYWALIEHLWAHLAVFRRSASRSG